MTVRLYRKLGEILPRRLLFQKGLREWYLDFLVKRGIRFTTVRINGSRMVVDLWDLVISRWLFLNRSWEPFESELVRRSLRPGMVFLDVGAHLGYYSLLAARAIGSSGRVLSFEPSPVNFQLLQENIRLNQLGGIIHAENAAVSQENGEVALHLARFNTGDHRIYATAPDDDEIFNGSTARECVRVPAIALDDYLARQGAEQVDVLKVDVQGAEMGVLLGMKKTLARRPDVVLFIEYWPHGLSRFGTQPAVLLNFLAEEAGLSLFHILPDEQRVAPVQPAEFAARAAQLDPRDQIDLIACRSPQSWFSRQ